MYAFFSIISIGPCHGNPRLLHTLVPYLMMSKYPKTKSYIGGMSNKNGQGKYRRRFLKYILFSLLSISVHVTGIPDFCTLYFHTGWCLDIPKGNTRWVVCQTKMDMGGTEDDFCNVCFLIVINIGPCHRNPRLLPNLRPYWMMSRHPKRIS